ncbi:MAG: dTDP-4-amino-4,6-dideoxygalactose transaminase [Balneola sp.]|jgi:dTDP-4-amino-4,6-dideoxygalactose transaminase|nr:dTDP-4-amino-4,6-dideoxygalactose transaminase [Balneola sp.]MBE79203.1 dTDP-4-amino-4,6-dideoxygalactose transaminase [Balneola sp.]HAD53311.1 dTDP-4-amino-4,6-dideoxygalactose transaminase [Algoriphagus sp.]|tara:strand:- start:265 stop:1482 length:1218 start_codon:yes stop_codon:yes gene_type:complete
MNSDSYHIPFNKPFITGNELEFIQDAVDYGKISGNGKYTQKIHRFFERQFGFNKCLLTTSCTDALEMAAILLEIEPGDEVIMPSYTFVSTANAFVLRGATIRFVDSRPDHPGIDEDKIEGLVTEKTKAIIVVHYAGVACDMGKVMDVANRHNLFVVEDAAQAINSFYIDEDGLSHPLGSIGHLGAFSFHETKNIMAGEGGMLVVNDDRFAERAEIIWEKGTNRTAFFRGEIDKYGWVDIGSSFLPSELNAAFLYAQLVNLIRIQQKRMCIWNRYQKGLESFCTEFGIRQPEIPDYATNNGHMYYLVCKDAPQRDHFIAHLKKKGILSVFHYQSLHDSPFFERQHDGRPLFHSDQYSENLVRLPFYYELSIEHQDQVIEAIQSFGDAEQISTKNLVLHLAAPTSSH